MALIQIESNKTQADGLPLFRLGFRPFFLLAGCAAVCLVLYWLYLFFVAGSDLYYGLINWHAHEMIFGYAVCVIAGFLLTAESNWTGMPTLKGPPLAMLALLWLAGRIVALLSLPGWLIASVDLAFLPMLAMVLLIPLLKTRQYQHMVFVVIAFSLFISNLLFHVGYLKPEYETSSFGIRLGWLLVLLLITVMGGRVIAFFIERGTGMIGKTRTSRSVEIGGYTSLLLWIVSFLFTDKTMLIASLAIVAGIIQAVRLWGWYLNAIWQNPMLWILFLGYACIPLGLLLFAYAKLYDQNISASVHAFTAGAIGLLTIGMMIRVSFGHTGREIRATRVSVVAFVCVAIGAVLRVAGSLVNVGTGADYYSLLVNAAGIIWAGGFVLFLVVLIPVLFRPRIDGRPG